MSRAQLKNLLRELLPPLGIRCLRYLQGELSAEFVLAGPPQDRYLNFLWSLTGGWMTPGHLRAFEHSIQTMPEGGAVVEIGSFLGKSTNTLGYLLERQGRPHPLFSCDPWILDDRYDDDPLASPYFDTRRPDYREGIKQTFIINGRVFGRDRLPHTLEATSQDFLQAWSERAQRVDVFGRSVQLGGPISFAYIDGLHTYEATRRDFLGIHEHLQSGGLVFFDDSSYATAYPGTRKFTQELCRHPEYRLVWKTPDMLFRKL